MSFPNNSRKKNFTNYHSKKTEHVTDGTWHTCQILNTHRKKIRPKQDRFINHTFDKRQACVA